MFSKNQLIGIALAVLAITVSALIFLQPKTGAFASAHDHADFAVFINGQKIDFSQAKYQTKIPNDPSLCGDTSKLAHLHAGDGNVAHEHATGVTWQYFISTLNITLSKDCIEIDGNSYCSSDAKKLRFMENGRELQELGEINDLSKVLISYGSENLTQQFAQVTDEAKLQGKGPSCAGEANHSQTQVANGSFDKQKFAEEYFKVTKTSFYSLLL